MWNVTICVPAFDVLLWELATQRMSPFVFQPLMCCYGNWLHVECHHLCSSFWCVAMGVELATCGMSPFVFQLLVCCYGNWLHVECHHLCSSFWCVAMGTGYMWNVTICVPAFGVLLWELATCGMSPFVFQPLVCCYGNWLHVECHHLCSSF